MTKPLIRPVCIGCGKNAEDLDEYRDQAASEEMTPAEFVRENEGTYNPTNGHFACTACYIAMGMPATPDGWVAP